MAQNDSNNETLYRSSTPWSVSSALGREDDNNSSIIISSSLLLRPTYLVTLTGLCLGAYVVYLIVDRILFATRVRRCYRDIPSAPRHWALGNLQQAGEKLNPSLVRHPDYGFEEIWEELGRPEIFLVDLAPVDLPMVVVTDPGVTEQIVQPSAINKYSCLKSDTVGFLRRLMGRESMVTSEGETWRALRKRFNKGFSPAHLHTLSPLVVSKTKIFCDRLAAAAATGETFTLRDYAQDLATDIITTIAIQKDFGSQSVPEGEGSKGPFGFLTASRKLSTLQYRVGQGFSLLHFLDPIRPLKATMYERIQNRELENLIRQRLKDDREESGGGSGGGDKKPSSSSSSSQSSLSGKSIVQLALSGLTPTDDLIANTRDQIKTFLFAGQDTTATTMQWICYELAKASHSPRHAGYLDRLRAEHDTVFGPADPRRPSSYISSALDALSVPEQADQILGDKLPYTTAFIKEVLRIHPPAATARRAEYNPRHQPPQTLTFSDPASATGDKITVRVDGCRMYPCHWIIQRNTAVWGPDATRFNPDRWFDEEYMRKLPVGSWRVFERGPRNCIGQELAMMELKVVLCVVARGFVFEKMGPQTGREGEPDVFNAFQVTAVPSDGMLMKIRLRDVEDGEAEEKRKTGVRQGGDGDGDGDGGGDGGEETAMRKRVVMDARN